jgi:mercuric ion transport protein
MEATRHPKTRAENSAIRDTSLGVTAMLALLSASCCIIPLALTIVGLGGAWLSVLDPFVAYRELILIGVTVIVLLGWWRVWQAGGQMRGVVMASVTSLAAVLGWTAPMWEWELSRVLLSYWSG